jgi:putative NIF3 family GTP cyclohydrolase 1 type 2
MKVKDIADAIDGIVPLKLAQDWDNVGLLIGNPEQNVKNVLLTIDITGAVVTEAKRLKTDLIISYHPVIWDGLKTITTHGPTGVVYDLIRSKISVFSIRRPCRDYRHQGRQAHRRLCRQPRRRQLQARCLYSGRSGG